jgi:hypothetical protein
MAQTKDTLVDIRRQSQTEAYISKLQLRDIRVDSVNFIRHDDGDNPEHRDWPWEFIEDLTQQFSYKYDAFEAGLYVFGKYWLEVFGNGSQGMTPPAELTLVYRIEYRCDSSNRCPDPLDEGVAGRAFNGLLWPYFREFTQSMFAHSGIYEPFIAYFPE